MTSFGRKHKNTAGLVAAASAVFGLAAYTRADAPQPKLGFRSVRLIETDGLKFKDLNKNGSLEPYEDWRRTAEDRARDLVSRMTLEEKAGVMMHGTVPAVGRIGAGMGGTYDISAAEKLITGKKINTFITRLSASAKTMAEQNNELQQIAERSRLGVPITVSTDPRSHFQYTAGASAKSTGFSQWPETLGLAAAGDDTLVRGFGDIARQEYRAVGMQEALSPQADLATEPRWSRINGTFGEDAALAKRMVKAYVEGFQGGDRGVERNGVATVVKHWVGYGAQKNGFDSHNAYGRFAIFPGNNFEYHLIPFTGAFEAHVSAVMPTYSILQGVVLNGTPLEQVGGGFNKQLLDLLRTQYKFDGVILSDWGITNACADICQNGFPAGQKPDFSHVGMPWGVENVSPEERFAKTINAGVDQIGGSEDVETLVAAVRSGKIREERVTDAAVRILRPKFQQGLFEDPYSDAEQAVETVGNPKFQEKAIDAQRLSLVLLENKQRLLPLKAGKKVFLHQIDAATANECGLTSVSETEAEIAILRMAAPYQTLHPQYMFGSLQHEGDLSFHDGNADYELVKRLSARMPTIVTIYLDRPAILTNIRDKAGALIANFGVSDRALLDVLTGKAAPSGKLPFELPSSMAEVEEQASDIPHDTAHPLYRFGFGLSY